MKYKYNRYNKRSIMPRTTREICKMCCGIREEEENDAIRTVGEKQIWGRWYFSEVLRKWDKKKIREMGFQMEDITC